MKFSRIMLAGLAIASLAGCGSFAKVVESNEKKKSEHMQFQVNRIGLVDRCYARATTDNQFSQCSLLQMQLQAEQGFTVTSEQNALPRTPEEQALDAAKLGGKLWLGNELGSKLIDGLGRTNDIVDREVPVFIERDYLTIPEGSQLLN